MNKFFIRKSTAAQPIYPRGVGLSPAFIKKAAAGYYQDSPYMHGLTSEALDFNNRMTIRDAMNRYHSGTATPPKDRVPLTEMWNNIANTMQVDNPEEWSEQSKTPYQLRGKYNSDIWDGKLKCNAFLAWVLREATGYDIQRNPKTGKFYTARETMNNIRNRSLSADSKIRWYPLTRQQAMRTRGAVSTQGGHLWITGNEGPASASSSVGYRNDPEVWKDTVNNDNKVYAIPVYADSTDEEIAQALKASMIEYPRAVPSTPAAAPVNNL